MTYNKINLDDLKTEAVAIKVNQSKNGEFFGAHLGNTEIMVGWHFKNETRDLVKELAYLTISKTFKIYFYVNTGTHSFLPNEIYEGEVVDVILKRQPQFAANLKLVPAYYTDEFKDAVNVLFKVKNLRLVSASEYEKYSYALEDKPSELFDFENFFNTRPNISKLVAFKKQKIKK